MIGAAIGYYIEISKLIIHANSEKMLAAAHAGDLKTLKSLFERGRRPDIGDNHGWTPLHHAVVKGHTECVNYLLGSCLPEFNLTIIENYEGQTALMLGVLYYPSSTRIIEALLKANPNSANICNNELQSPLQISCLMNRPLIVELLIKAGAILNFQDYNSESALHSAVESSNLECVDILLHAGADASLRNVFNYTALHVAFINKRLPCIYMLLQFMCDEDLSITGEDNCTLLMHAARWGNIELLNILLSRGLDPYLQDSMGRLAVHYAFDSVACTRILLNAMERKEISCLENIHHINENASISFVKTLCELAPELFAKSAVAYLFQHWGFHREECIHIIQLLLSQVSICDSDHFCEIDSPLQFSNIVDLIDTLVYYGQSVHIFWNIHPTLYNSNAIYVKFGMPIEVWSMRALACINPLYFPHVMLRHRPVCCQRIHRQIPKSWEIEFDEGYNIIQHVQSLKQLCRIKLRTIMYNFGGSSYNYFKHALGKLNLPFCLVLYIQYLEGCD